MIITREELPKYEKKLGHGLEDLLAMPLGTSYYIGDSDNKIKHHTEDEWIFLRFDSKHTHLEPEEVTGKDTQKIWQDFREACNYAMKYGQTRCDAISEAFDEELAASIVSSDRFMNQQVKTTSSFLSGESGFTKTLETIADFICFAKFDNREQEEIHEEMKNERIRLEKIYKKQRKEREEKRLARLKDDIADTPYSMTKKLIHPPKHFNMASVDMLLEVANGITPVEQPVNYSKVDRYLNDGEFLEGLEGFWNRISPKEKHDIPHYTKEPVPFKEMAMDIMTQYQDEIDRLNNKPFSPELAKVISNLKSEKRTALESLRKVITVNPTPNIEETIPHDSWDRLSFRDTNTYNALLFSYYDACKKYNNKPSTYYWAILRDFESLLEQVEWSKEEAVIISYILETGVTEYKEIQNELLKELDFEISPQTLSNWLNKTIPNKLVTLNERILEDWIWIYRRKGKYKTCSKSGEVKLIVDDRYFRRRKDSKDGFRSICKEHE